MAKYIETSLGGTMPKAADLIEPVPIELDKVRHIKLNGRAMLRAEREINKQRGAAVADRVSIDYLMISAARQGLAGAGSFPRDLVAAVLWAGLLDEDPALTFDRVVELMDQSPLPRGKIVDAVWEAYETSARKAKPEEANGEDKEFPLSPPPGSSSGARPASS